ncbi:hypothetical protein Tco_0071243 [Tanacetum coccineum]
MPCPRDLKGIGIAENMMGEVDIETLTMEQYLMLTQRNQAPGMVKPKFGMKEKDIEDMTIAEYMEYESKMKRQNMKIRISTIFTIIRGRF